MSRAIDEVFEGGGELGARMRAIDWSGTPLGPVEAWPQSLKTCVRVVLTSRQPMFVWWGDSLINLYNDAYKAIVGGKHPAALGQPASEVWREIWGEIEPRAKATMLGNEGTYDEALLLIMERYGYPEETYYTFSYSPVPNDQGGTGGIFCANSDDTQRIIGERQLTLLRELAARTAEARTPAEVCVFAAECLAADARDLPFALLYLTHADRRGLSLEAVAGIERGHPAAPEAVPLEGPCVWPLREVVERGQPLVVEGLEGAFEPLPRGPWNRPPARAVALPVTAPGAGGPAGVLVVGLNPYRLYDDGYRGFLGLVAGQIAASLSTARAHEGERQRAEALAQLDRAKTAFFSNVSHEFRTPLTLMLGPLDDVLADEGQVTPQGREALEVVHRNGLRLLKLVNTLLDFARIEAKRAEVLYEPTDLATLTAELASNFRSAVEKAGMALRVECPPLGEPAYVDRDMWEKIVLNLVSNAFKHTFEGAISVGLRPERDDLVLEVRDTGIGIPPDELPRLFERFHRVREARARTQEGTGIGLALVNELARLHGGSVGVESEVGVGTTFRVRVPRGRAHLPDERVGAARVGVTTSLGATPFVEEALRWLPAPAGGAPLPPSATAASEAAGDRARTSAAAATVTPGAAGRPRPLVPQMAGRRWRVLLADDNADMRDYVERLLREYWDVEAVSDGEAALASARRSPPDLVLSDVMMPGLDGFGLLAALRGDERTAAVPVILLSARAGEEAALEGFAAGAADYLVKPFSSRELVARVATHVALGRARRAERAAQQRLTALFLQAPVAVSVLRGPELTVELTNARYDQMVGRRVPAGGRFREVFPELPDDAPVFQMLREVRASGEAFSAAEYCVPLARGGRPPEDAFFLFTCQPVREADGEVDTILTVAVEVTEQVELRRRIERLAERERAARQDAEEASRLKDEFLATLSHELRTPLTAIVGWVSMLRDPRRQHEAWVEKALEVIDRNVKAQAQIINDVLDVSRIVTGKLNLEPEPFAFDAIVREAAETVQHAADAKRLHLAVDAEPSPLVGDPARLRQVCWNLLANAVRYTPPGGSIRLTLRRTANHLVLAVADTGMGIEPSFLPHVWESFRQADGSSTRRFGGLGLGLSIVRHLVELHGGWVEAESEGLGKGSTFRAYLPAEAAPPAPAFEALPGALEEMPPSLGSGRLLQGRHVLLVEDEDDSRELFVTVLAGAGATVSAFGSARDALAALPGARPDLLLFDVGLPGLDGYALLAQARAAFAVLRGVPAVALTAYARREDVDRALAAGFARHLAKPVNPDALVQALRDVLDEHAP